MPSIQHKTFTSFDNTQIGYHMTGSGKKAFILCNGLGGPFATWSPVYKKFNKHFKFISWDYRGLYTSERPEKADDVAISHHTKDLNELLKTAHIKKAIFCGWSMGVQVCLEFYKNHPEKFDGMILVNGTCGSPYATALNSSLTKYVLPLLNGLIKKAIPVLQPHLQPLAEAVIDTNEFIKIITRLGLSHENLDSKLFKTVAHQMIKTDLFMFHNILGHLSEHNACDVLSKINVPTLIVAGGRDIMTPCKVAENMAQSIPASELFVVDQASHYSLLEFPHIITKRMAQFLSEHFKTPL